MKIKNKLIAGGLMSVVACALVGSITGTFAWYQYSNRSTVSMKGASVGTAENLEILFGEYNAQSNPWSADNLSWAKICGNETEASNAAKLSPVSNGENDGDDPLGATWYGNPNNASKTMPVYTDDANGGYYQFSFKVRYAVNEGGNDTYPAATLYVSDIASNTIVEDPSKDVTFALRMHVQFGTGNSAQYFLVNPYNPASVDTTCSTEIEARNYDWTNNNARTLLVPTNATANSEPNEQVAAHVVTKTHASVISTFNNDGTLDTAGSIAVPVSGENGIDVTVTFWLEGFAESTQGTASTDWWTGSTTIGDTLQFGFELTGLKNA